jgi:hypothetical protein
MEVLKLVLTFISGGFAGAIFKTIVDSHNNKIQKLDCNYIEDEVISKLPINVGDTTHNNLHSKKFIIVNTTNRDITEIKIVFSFEPTAIVAKWNSYSKAGVDIPKGNVYAKRNECHFVIKHFNRNEEIEVNLEIANVNEDKFNITELNITGVKVRYVDKRKAKAKKVVKLVEKRDLNASG